MLKIRSLNSLEYRGGSIPKRQPCVETIHAEEYASILCTYLREARAVVTIVSIDYSGHALKGLLFIL